MKQNVVSAFTNSQKVLDNVVVLDTKLTNAEQKVEEVKKVFGFGSSSERRLIFDALSDVKNIYNNLKKARVYAHDLATNYQGVKTKIDKVESIYEPVFKLVN